MKRVISIIAATAAITLTCGETPTEPKSGWVYGGELGYDQLGNYIDMGLNLGLDVFPNGVVYVVGLFDYPPTWPEESYVFYFNGYDRYLGRWWGGKTCFYDVAAAPSRGWVYVADAPNRRVLCYTTRGSLVKEWATDGAVRIAVSPADGTVYVAAGDSIQYFTATGSSLGAWGAEGSGDGQFRSPYGVAVAPDTGYVYVADTVNDRIQYFTASGSFLGKWGATGSGNGEFNHPFGVAVSPADGNVYVADKENHRIQYFTPEGSFVGKFGSYGLEEGDLRNPWGLRFNATGKRLYITGVPGPLLYFDYYD